MDKNKILSYAETIFNEFYPIDDNIYKGIRKVKDKAAGIYFLDVSGKLPDDIFAYQNNFIAEEYYNNPGPTQWNYYLILMQETELSDAQRKKEIENDEKFARKFVFSESQFFDFFDIKHNADLADLNVIGQLKQELEKVGLQEVYSSLSYAEIMRRFESNSSEKTVAVSKQTVTKDLGTIDRINYLHLHEQYRPFPLIKEFNFGSVNLIQGKNGVGKTSLFEAIELMICGRTLRSGHTVSKNCIEAKFNNQEQLHGVDCSQTSMFKELDTHWYGNYVTSRNDCQLQNSFNRFNFFNADAAYHFANSDSDREIYDALMNIILGPEYRELADRIDKIYEKMRILHNSTNAEIEKLKLELKRALEEIAEFESESDLTVVLQGIAEALKRVRFKKDFSDHEKQLNEIEAANTVVLNLALNIDKFPAVDSSTALKQQNEGLRKKALLLERIGKDMNRLNVERTDLLAEQQKLTLAVGKTERLLRYFADESFLALEGLDSSIVHSEFLLNKIRKIATLIGDVSLNDEEKKSVLSELSTKIAEKNRNAAEELTLLQKQLSDYYETLNASDKLIRELKALGQKYLTNAPTAESCPLCQSHFDRAELERRVLLLVQKSENTGDSTFRTLNENIEKLKQQIEGLNGTASVIAKITDAVRLWDDQLILLSASEILSSLHKEVAGMSAKELELTTKKNTKLAAQKAGLTEAELISLKKYFEENYPNNSIRTGQGTAFSQLLTKLQRDQQEIEEKNGNIENRRKIMAAEFKTAYGIPAEHVVNLKVLQENFNNEEALLKSVTECYERLNILIRLAPDDSIKALIVESELLARSIDNFKKEMHSRVGLANAKKRKQATEKSLKEKKELYTRVKSAFEKLAELYEDKGAAQTQRFLQANLEEILDIFKAIHAPQEFTDLQIEDKQIKLITHDDKGEKEERGIAEISTGQRSALVLSIFLTLNRKLKKGPNIIMFDDPVSFIDDLNALSFLDFLRYVVVKDGRQIFFATANARLASLFEKKFDFLGDDFAKWKLERT
jgi:DNA repair protein SbcC/Rad50